MENEEDEVEVRALEVACIRSLKTFSFELNVLLRAG